MGRLQDHGTSRGNVRVYTYLKRYYFDVTKISNPHPFVSLITLAKGKKLLPRLLRNVAPARLNLFLTLIVACYGQLDVVRDAPLLDRLEDTPQKREVERETDAFVASVVPLLMGLVKNAPLRLVSGLVGLLFEAGDLTTIAQTKVECHSS
jgi:DNA topoisomerase 2-associated protein PAT1